MKARTGLITAMVSLSVAWVFAADWPGYLGPTRNSISTEKGLLRTWPKEGPKVLWTAAVGIGYGGPAVSAGKVYLLDRDDTVGDKLRCLDLATGKELWNFAYDAPGKFDHAGLAKHPDRGRQQRLQLPDRSETCTASARARTSPSGARTSGRTSAARSCPDGR